MKEQIRAIIEYFEDGVQRALCEKLGVSSGNMCDWLSGKSNPRRAIQERLSALYPIDPAWLSTGIINVGVCKKINWIRGNARLLHSDFGARIGLSGNVVRGIEDGKIMPSEKVINDICSEFKINKSSLYDEIGAPVRPLRSTGDVALDEKVLRHSDLLMLIDEDPEAKAAIMDLLLARKRLKLK